MCCAHAVALVALHHGDVQQGRALDAAGPARRQALRCVLLPPLRPAVWHVLEALLAAQHARATVWAILGASGVLLLLLGACAPSRPGACALAQRRARVAVARWVRGVESEEHQPPSDLLFQKSFHL